MTRFATILAAAALAGASGCSVLGGRRLAASPTLSKARAAVRYSRAEDGSTRVVLRARGLPEPEGLTPPGYAYVAWVQSDREAEPQNLGALVLDQDLRGELRATTRLKDFELYVTAEPASDAERPSGPPLLWTHRDERMTAALVSSR